MKPTIPSPHIDEKDVDRLIASFGVKPAPEKRKEIENSLKDQKEQFLKQERGREHDRARTSREQ